MLVLDERIARTGRAMEKIEEGKEEQSSLARKDAKLSAMVRRMSREAPSVQRSGDVRKIARFNKIFAAAVRDISIIRRNRGRSNRDDVVEIIKQWEEKR